MLDIISSKNILPNRKWSVTVSWKCIVEQSHPSLWRNQYVCPSWPSDIFWLSHTEPSIYEIRTLSLSDLKGLNTSRDKNHVIHSGICACKCRRKKNPYNSSYQHYFKKKKDSVVYEAYWMANCFLSNQNCTLMQIRCLHNAIMKGVWQRAGVIKILFVCSYCVALSLWRKQRRINCLKWTILKPLTIKYISVLCWLFTHFLFFFFLTEVLHWEQQGSTISSQCCILGQHSHLRCCAGCHMAAIRMWSSANMLMKRQLLI